MWCWARRVGFSLALLQLLGTITVVSARQCSTTFSVQRSIYASCLQYDHNLETQETITGSDIIESLKTFCRDLGAYDSKNCFLGAYVGCQEDLVNLVNQLWKESTWMCHDGSLRQSFIDALNASGSNLPSRETNVFNCINRMESNECFYSTFNKFPGLRAWMMRSSISESVSEVISNRNATLYFYELFNCAYAKAKTRCPHNALPMAIIDHPHFLFPPKFGINVTDVLIKAAASIASGSAADVGNNDASASASATN